MDLRRGEDADQTSLLKLEKIVNVRHHCRNFLTDFKITAACC